MITSRSLVMFFFTYRLNIQHYHSAEQSRCTVMINDNFNSCESSEGKDRLNTNFEIPTCRNNAICRRAFNISYIQLIPYYDMKDLIGEMIDFCCGRCAAMRVVHNFSHTYQTNMNVLSTSDFVFPVLGMTSSQQMYGFHFVPIVQAPDTLYITLGKKSPKEIITNLITTCANMWPLVLISVLLSLISGFVAWCGETWNNTQEFPRAFHVGLFQGFWWSFVSMTTVGYGDKTPRSRGTRMFAVLWIIIGITVCSIFTASMTNAITSAITPENPIIAGMKIGWLKYRTYEAIIIAQYGGVIIPVDTYDHIKGINILFDMLQEEKIDGMLLDQHLFNTFKKKLIESPYGMRLNDLINNKTVIKVIKNKLDDISLGLLIRSPQHNDYFRNYILDNKLHLETCKRFRMNLDVKPKEEAVSLFSVEAGLFWPVAGACAGFLAVIFCFGFTFEFFRKRDMFDLNRNVNKNDINVEAAAEEERVRTRPKLFNSSNRIDIHISRSASFINSVFEAGSITSFETTKEDISRYESNDISETNSICSRAIKGFTRTMSGVVANKPPDNSIVNEHQTINEETIESYL